MTPLGRGDVARLRFDDDTTVIAKRSGRDPRNAADERAGLAFLGDHGASPALLHANDDYVVIEDLRGPSVADLLLGTDMQAARDGLVGLARCLGELGAWAMPRLSSYEALRVAAGPPRTRRLTHQPSSHDTFRQRLVAARIALPAGLDDDFATVDRVVYDPGPFRTFVHGDPCPDNTIVGADGTVQLFDFEWSGTGHALLDGVYVEVPFPTCWCYGSIPDDVVAECEVAYRSALAAGCPAATDDAAWQEALACASASWWLAGLDEFLARSFERETVWGTATDRQRVVHRGSRFAALAARTGMLPALGAASSALADHVRDTWSAEPVPAYPAFSGR